jgi:hypothetical protein
MKRGTLLGIIKDAGLTTDEFIKLLCGCARHLTSTALP